MGLVTMFALVAPAAAQTADPAPDTTSPAPIPPETAPPTTAPPGAPTPTAAPAPPPRVPPPDPFRLSMDAGPRSKAQAARAKLDIAALEPELATAIAQRDQLQARWDALTAQLAQLDIARRRTIVELDAARVALGASAAKAYVHRGGGRLDAALDAMASADDAMDIGRDLHLLTAYGDHEIDLFERLEAEVKAIDRELLDVADERVEAKEQLEAATTLVNDVDALLANAHQRLTEAETELARFHEMATTAGSPILGPNRLTAQQLADFVRASGQAPNITVTIDELAQLYIEESEKLGVRGDVAWAQSILETGTFGFQGSMVEPEDNNFAGIGACDSCTRGYRFAEARLGVRAQMQLLRVYVDPDVTETSLPDPLLLPRTLRLGFRGKVQSWWDLTGTWATAYDYGIRVYDLYQRMVGDTQPMPPVDLDAGR
jgi:hypothetical protein